MNKIYNNLTIDNLIKTDWFNQFDEYQQLEITEGLEDNLDVLIYANSKFNSNQMWQIREGLEDSLDVSVYAIPEYHWTQMEQIRLGLKDNLDVSIYTRKDFHCWQMENIRIISRKSKFITLVYIKLICCLNKIGLN